MMFLGLPHNLHQHLEQSFQLDFGTGGRPYSLGIGLIAEGMLGYTILILMLLKNLTFS
jgi:hypothetical protein